MQKSVFCVPNNTDFNIGREEEITLHLKLRAKTDSLEGQLLSFLKNSRTSATQMLLEAARAYWLALACVGNKPPEQLRAIAHECIRNLQIQEGYISTVSQMENKPVSIPIASDVSPSQQIYQAFAGVGIGSDRHPFSSQDSQNRQNHHSVDSL